MISKKLRVSLAKTSGLTGTRPGQTDLGRWIMIVRSRVKRYADLISCVGSGSDGLGRLGARVVAALSPVTISAAARRRSAPNSVLRSEIRVGIGSGKISATRVIHLGLKRVSSRLWAVRAMVEAGLCSGASPACEHSRCWGSERVQTGAVHVRGAKASQNRSRAWLCCAVGGPPRRSRGVCHRRPVLWPRGCVLDHDI